MDIRQIFLLVTAVGLAPIALFYGVWPQQGPGYLLDVSIDNANGAHIFRAVMGLYLAMTLFWIIGALKWHVRQAALWSLVVFMLGLVSGRLLSLLLDGIPHWFLLISLAFELVLGALGLVLLNRAQALEVRDCEARAPSAC